MRMRTIRNRMRLACLPEEALQELYNMMRGISEHSYFMRDMWPKVVKKVLDKYTTAVVLRDDEEHKVRGEQ